MATTPELTPSASRATDSGRIVVATLVWSAIYAAFGAGSLLTATPLRSGGVLPLHPMAPAWLAVIVGVAATLMVILIRVWPRRVTRYGLWLLCGGAGLGAWSLLMDIAAVVVAQPVDSVPGAVAKVIAAVEAVLLAATIRSISPRRSPDRRSTVRWPDHVAAIGGTAAFVPYVVMKGIWVSGGTFAGMSGAQVRQESLRNGASGVWLTLQSWGLDLTVLLAIVGVILLWGLVRPWGETLPAWIPRFGGRRAPRWLLITPALIGVGTLVPYGVLGLGYVILGSAGVLSVRAGDFPTPADALLAGWVGMIAFAGYGIALAVATRSYASRTRARFSDERSDN